MARAGAGADPLVALFREPGPAWVTFEQALEARGVPLALQTSAAWVGRVGGNAWLVGLLDAHGAPRCGFGVAISRSRALPGARILRVPRFGHGIPLEAVDAACAALGVLARRAGALRLHVELYVPEGDLRTVLVAALTRSGFMRSPRPRSYERTVLIDLRPSEADLLASFHSTCRRHIRALSRHPLECRTIEDPSLGGRLNALSKEAMGRTGGRYSATNWAARIAFIAEHPDRARLLGVFRADTSGPDSLVGYVLGLRHGDTVEYGVAASTRLAGGNVPLLYAPTWELIRWARGIGAATFDFGGVTTGTAQSGDPVGGISDFKRYFSTNVVEVGGELVIEPPGWRSRIATTVSAAVAAVRRAGRGTSRSPATGAP